MKITKLLPRSEYKKYLKNLKENCVFCDFASKLIIKKFSLWIWEFAAFPYKKYHTLLILKRHIINFSDLNAKELLELAQISKKLEKFYRDVKIIGKNSTLGNQLFACWRTPQDNVHKKPLAHLHLHFYPETNDEDPTDKDSWDIDMNIFMKK